MKSSIICKLALTSAGLGLIAGSASAELIVDLGNNGSDQLNQVSATATVNVTDASESSAFTSGTFTTTGGPITFDFSISGTNGDVIGQNQAFGITGGSAAAGIDNNNSGSGPFEAMTFTISDFTGLGTGETLEITGLSVLFADTTESYTLNGGSSTLFSADSTGGNPAQLISVSGTTVSIGAGVSGDTKFAIDSFTVSVVPVPEPSAFALLAGFFGLAWIMVRRR